MSLVKVGPGLFENYTFIARPHREFSSSSSGLTGTIKVYPQASVVEKNSSKDNYIFSDSSGSLYDEINSTATDISVGVLNYIDSVNSLSSSPRSSKEVKVVRFVPSPELNKDTRRKGVIKSILYPFYASAYPSCAFWGNFNYLSLNFVSGSGFSSDAALAYPSPNLKLAPNDAFTFEFYIKPTMRTAGSYNAGTILHMSSSFAISIISGSQLNPEGKPDSFKIQLQLSHSSETSPSSVDFSNLSYPNDLIFTSSDDITFNGWHHVAIRWGGTASNFGSGSFFIDGIASGDFSIPSSSLNYSDDSNALFIGNFYDGENAGSNKIEGLFKSVDVLNEGFSDVFSSIENYPSFVMKDQLGAELHEIRIWNEFRDISLIRSGASQSPGKDENLKFYLGPHFTHESVDRNILYSPFLSFSAIMIDTPVNTQMAFNSNGHLINAENHLRDHITGYFPRLINMTSSLQSGTPTSGMTANDYLFNDTKSIKKNLLILPCDNGKFTPDFTLLSTSSETPYFIFTNSRVDLSNIVTKITSSDSPDWSSAYLSPDNLDGDFPAHGFSYIQSGTRDPSSNLVSIFDISNLYYGSKIHPETFSITDSNFTGSNGLLSFTLKDNGMGGLYRADATTTHAKWNAVGSLIYEEGLAVITAPYFGDLFGKDSFSMNFQGEKPVHTLTANISVPAYKINSSSMPNYLPLTASDYANESKENFVYINRVNLHDENFNIVGRADLAQSIPKRTSDKFIIRTKFDF